MWVSVYRSDDAAGLIVVQHLQYEVGDAAETYPANREGAM
jgi:hypothetical protein